MDFNKQLLFKDEARKEVKKGIDLLADAVKVTMGPKGRNVALGCEYGTPHITKDGVTVAKEISVENPYENMGVQLIREAADNTSKDAGDGTTTATVLTQSIIDEGLNYLNKGFNPIELKKGIDEAVNKVVAYIKENSIQIKDNWDKIKQVAFISTNGDENLTNIIIEGLKAIGTDGIISVEEGTSLKDEIDIKEGIQFERGYTSPYFITDIEKEQVNHENPYILLCEDRITNFKDIFPILKATAGQGLPLIIISEDLSGEAFNNFILNRIKQALPLAAVKAPGYGVSRKDYIQDVAILTGGMVFSSQQGTGLSDVLKKINSEDDILEYLGSANKVIIEKENTTIIDGKGDVNQLKERISQLRARLENSDSEFDKEAYKERLAKLSNGVGIIKIGGNSEVEIKEKKDRVDDALCAVRSAIEEGIIAGGGVTYIKANEVLEDFVLQNKDISKAFKAGIQIVSKSLTCPLETILDNAGMDTKAVNSILTALKDNEVGYDAREEKFVQPFEKGIVDSAKVARVALENAASTASMFLTMECSIVSAPKKDNCNK